MYSISLDIGVTSVGHAVLELDTAGTPFRIITAGSRIFDAAEQPKTGESLAKPRRDARGARRRSRRHVHRLDRIKALLQKNNIITKQALSNLYAVGGLSDIYAIRCEALDRSLTKEEFARLLVFFAQRRGFKSNRKADAKDKEAGLMLGAINENQKRMEDGGYRTVGEMLYKHQDFAGAKRNKTENYKNTVSRDMLVAEIKQVFAAQRAHQNTDATPELETVYLAIFESQRSFEEGPGGDSPYGGNQIEKMIGRCTFLPEEPRAAKASYTAEYATLLEKLNSLRIISSGEKRALTNEERAAVVALAHKTEALTFAHLRKTLVIADTSRFNLLSYGEKDRDEVEKAKFQYLKAYHAMRKVFNKISKDYIRNISVSDRDALGWIFTCYKTDAAIQEKLAETTLTKEEQEIALDLPTFRNVRNLSLKALQIIVPHLEEGLKYNEACEAAGFAFKAHDGKEKKNLLPPLPQNLYEITSPVVKRSINQSILVINEIIKKYGAPALVQIELAREVSKNFQDRKKIEREQGENRAANDRIRERLRNEFHVPNPNGQDVLKLKLWQEQDGYCPYTGKTIPAERLFEKGYCEIDHIVPYSFTYDDKFTNKVLVMTYANREKKNRLPLEYIKDRERFIVWVNSSVKNYRKRENFLRESISEEEMREQKDRNLTDTQHITSFLRAYIEDNLQFDPALNKKKRVIAVNGRITAYMRNRWGIRKVREDGDLHHAVDAVVVGCINDGIIRKVTGYLKAKENEYQIDPETGELYDTRYFPEPWENFRTELNCRFAEDPVAAFRAKPFYHYTDEMIDDLKPFFVSRMKRKKVTGSAHEATIRSGKEVGWSVTKTPLTSLKLNKEKTGIEGYYMPDSDRLLHELLVGRLLAHGGDAKKAFAEPVYKPAPEGGVSPLVKKVKIRKKIGIGVTVNGGLARNGDMVRIDLFYVAGDGYYFVPIYVPDMVKGVLPNKAVVPGKDALDWKVMKNEDFIFSLYPNDLVRIIAKNSYELSIVNEDSTLPRKKEGNEMLLYYRTADSEGAKIQLITHDHTYRIKSKGIKTLLKIEKYAVDPLGNIQVCGKEIRSGTLK